MVLGHIIGRVNESNSAQNDLGYFRGERINMNDRQLVLIFVIYTDSVMAC